MYSGSDSTESANYGQWPLNPTFFQNMPNEQVDWAALAQQWIQMKEAGPPLPEPKPVELKKENEKIDKEVVLPNKTEEGTANASWSNVSGSTETFDNSWNWKTQQSWEWGNNWNSQLNPPQIVAPSNKPTLLPTPKTYTSGDSSTENTNLNSGYSSSRNSDFGTGFSGHSTNHSRHYKPHNRRYSKVNIPKATTSSPSLNISAISDIETSNLDASKRKQLPAWIREGLEKMERDKLKQIEKEKEKEKHSVYTEKIKEQEKETMEILKDTIKERRRSKFDSDDEQSPKRLEVVKEQPEPLNHDELMLLVRRTMTEILLKVTNEAIHSLCTEERQRYIKRIQILGKTSGKTNVSAKLGLGMYGSDSGSESDDTEGSIRNSDDELKTVIKKRKAEFLQTERGIEDKLLQAEQKKGNTKINDDESEDNSSDNQSEDHISQNKRDEEINLKTKTYSNVKRRDSSHSSEESDKESIRRKSSSRSSESNMSARRRNRSRSRDRGYTPEKRQKHKSPKRSRSRSYDRRHSTDNKNKKDRSRVERSRRSRSRTSRRSRSRSSSYRSRRSSETSSRSRRKRSRSPKRSRRSRSKSYIRSSRTR